ncbi:Metallo-dependent phosphatase-like protein [Kockiozyma suomiensis]|uniref:Metallo-dependent phosphatase-like protein n=1 Tax=Kockiozyma suomiensis TaxID=1337062 RepID=UPI003343B811
MVRRVLAFARHLLRARLVLVLILTTLSFLIFSVRSHGADEPSDIIFASDVPDILIRDIAIRVCPRIFSGSCALDGYRKIHKDLRLGNSWLGRAYLFAADVPRSSLGPEDLVVLDVHIGPNSPEPVFASHPLPTSLQLRPEAHEQRSENTVVRSTMNRAKPIDVEEGETAVDNRGNWILKSHNLWLKLGKPTDFAVSDVDVLFGVDAVDPRFGWSLKGDRNSSLLVGSQMHPRITIRLGGKQEAPTVKLRVNTEGKFKIIQVADLHLSTGVGECMDSFPEETAEDCEADPRTLSFLSRLLDQEKPDFAVLTGDQIFGDAAPDAQTALLKAASPFIFRRIPFAMTFGNHDDEGNLSRAQLMDIVSSLPYSLSRAGPDFARGIGNYQQTVFMYKKDQPALSMYFLDTHKYSPNPKQLPGYDWLDESQLEFLKASYQQLTPLRSQDVDRHLSMAFFHIPLTEYLNTSNPLTGSYREPSTAPRHNTGARSLLSELGVSVVSVGHDHVNDFCMYDRSYSPSDLWNTKSVLDAAGTHAQSQKGVTRDSPMGEGSHPIWLCHGGGAGLGGYGGYGGYVRRMRLFEIDVNTNSISTWKRLENGDIGSQIDYQILVEGGKLIQI